MIWSIERDALLREQYGAVDGMSAAELAARLGVTRSAVIGRAHRLGLKCNPLARQARTSDGIKKSWRAGRRPPMRGPANQPPEIQRRVCDLYPSRSAPLIARELGLSIDTVYKIAKAHNVEKARKSIRKPPPAQERPPVGERMPVGLPPLPFSARSHPASTFRAVAAAATKYAIRRRPCSWQPCPCEAEQGSMWCATHLARARELREAVA